jgi:hypothetical protein
MAQPLHSRLVTRVHHQVEPAQPFDRDDRALTDGLGRPQQRHSMRSQGMTLTVPELKLRATARAGIRLGVEAPVERIVVLGLTLLAHREVVHRSVGAIVG